MNSYSPDVQTEELVLSPEQGSSSISETLFSDENFGVYNLVIVRGSFMCTFTNISGTTWKSWSLVLASYIYIKSLRYGIHI